jgi:hypothetical protein
MKRLFASRGRVLAHIRGNAIAYFALFFALGGTSVAATDRLLPPNSVGSAQVINGSLQKTDLARSAVNALKGNGGPQGPAGAAGSVGPIGPSGQQGLKGDAGAPGAPGTPGTNGTNGTNGVSVTSAVEPVGANCANGGSKFTAANGVTYACKGAKGDKGDKGDPGPANLAALQGSPCTFAGNTSSLDAKIDATTGAISMTCVPVYLISVTVTGGTLDHFALQAFPHTSINNICAFVSSCSLLVPAGDNAGANFYNWAPFHYSCDGGPSTPSGYNNVFYTGSCFGTSLHANYPVTVTIP